MVIINQGKLEDLIGIKFDEDQKNFKIETSITDCSIFDFRIKAKNVRWQNGNGIDRLLLIDDQVNSYILERSGWKLTGIIRLNFNWSCRNASFDVIDPNGLTKTLRILANGNLVFNRKDWNQDICVIFNEFFRISKFNNWANVDGK